MEPDKIEPQQTGNPNPQNQNPPQNLPGTDSTDDLRAEGVDIVGTSMALDNEFSKPEMATFSDEGPSPERDIDAPSESGEPASGATASVPAPVAATPVPNKQKSDPIIYSRRPIDMPITEQPVEPLQESTPVPPPPQPANDPSIKPIRTFKSDAEEAVRYSNVSKVDIAVAEQKKREASNPIEYVEEKKSSGGIYIILVLVVLLLGAGGWYYWFSSTGGSSTAEKPATVSISWKPIVTYAQGASIVIDPNDTENDPFSLMALRMNTANPGVGNVFALIPIETATATSPEPVEEVFSQTHIPDRLARSLGGDYMIGMYSYNHQIPFIILKNTYFQNAFSGMLDWEKDMGGDLLPFIRFTYPGETETSLAPNFEDAVVSNIDVRTLKDANGNIVLAYAFADKDTIVITTDEGGLKYLLDRLLS
ncbi:MAG TPA: hypothetical protein VFT82_01465, partial [Candidatus Paceibacterota bacterium]|nr:hypothetical protein [Candidatus Paceibacterota bacterium]